jgi:peptidoglycan/LPS O-acetylase OafA/YrhL
MVMVHHTEQLKAVVGLPNGFSNPWIFGLGSEGVNMFFVLSGFLITYLLLAEQERFGEFSVPQFYVRRLLRIHPLYFLLIFIAFVIGPHLPTAGNSPVNLMIRQSNQSLAIHFRHELALFLCMAPNLALILYPQLLFAFQCWSIGVEEQFYLLWPWLLRAIRDSLVRSLAILILLKVVLDIVVTKILPMTGHPISPTAVYFIVGLRLDSLALGALAASAFFLTPDKIRGRFFSVWAMRYWMLMLGAAMAVVPLLPIHHVLWPVICVLLILNLVTTTPASGILENPICNFLGKISYGLYMYHACAITLALKVLEWVRPATYRSGQPGGLWMMNGVLYLTTMLFTILFATISYYFIEKKFLDLKQKSRSISNPG